MMEVKEDHPPPAGKFQAELRLYLEPVTSRTQPLAIPPADAAVPDEEGYPQLAADQLLLFLKFYEPAGEQLSFVGTHVAHNHHMLQDLLPVLRRARSLPADAELMVYEEVEFETSVRFEPIAAGKTLKDSELQSGDILVFQHARPMVLPPPPTIASTAIADVDMEVAVDGMDKPTTNLVLESERDPLLTIPAFFEHVKNRVVVHVHKLPPQQHHGQGVRQKERAIQIAMDKRWTYDQVTGRIAQTLSLRSDYLRLTMHNPYSDLPKPQPLKFRGVDTLQDMLTSFQKSTDQLFYEALDIPLQEYESKKSLKVSWHNTAAEEVTVVNLLLDKDCNVGNALDELVAMLQRTKTDSAPPLVPSAGHPLAERRMRMMEVFNHRIYKIFADSDEIETINDQYWTIRAEEVPEDELVATEADKLVHVRHFYRDTRMNMTHNFGDPFLLLLGAEETTASVRHRIQAKLSLSDDELTKWKLAVISFGRVEYLEDDEIVKARFRKQENYGNWDDYLGLEHAQVPGSGRKKSSGRTGYADKPIKIHG